MRKLGRGLQYVTYDIGKGRVFKRVTTYQEKMALLETWDYPTKTSRLEKLKSVDKHLKTSIRGVRSLLNEYPSSHTLLGNPIFENGCDYTQDKIIPFGEYIQKHTLTENKKIIKNYVLLEHKLWQYGMSDDTRKPILNNGVYADGTVILIDFGEAMFQKDQIAKYIRNNRWLTKYTLGGLKNKQLQDYITNLVKKEITLEKLNYHWKRRIKHTI